MKKKSISVVLAAAMLVAFSGCGKEVPMAETAKQQQGTAASVKNEPVTITFFSNSGATEEELQTIMLQHIKAKLPHITINLSIMGKGNSIQDFLTGGNIPDLINLNPTYISQMSSLDLLEDLSPLLKKNNFDLSRFQDGVIDAVKMYGPQRELLAIPWSINPYALYYNKDIFDKFGVEYPKDGMTWDKIYELAKQVTRSVDGVKYRGFDMDNAGYIRNNPLSMNVIDPKTEQPVINTNAWKMYLENLKRFYDIPGNLVEKMPNADLSFYRDKTLAMRVGPSLFSKLKEGYDTGDRFNWDLVTLPSFPEQPGTNIPWTGGLFTVSKHSKHKDAVLQIIDLMLSEEVQMQGTTLNRATVLKSQSLINAFGGGNDFSKGKNVAAIGKYKTALGMEQTEYNTQTLTIMNTKFSQAKTGTKDLNTALREAEEEISKYIIAEKKK